MKLNYRPEIDGLRALAVTAVILYHAQIYLYGVNYFKGGFIGVDIFFVISGYLISSIILKELKTSGKFSFKIFYERRARRILPALFFVMLVSLPFAWKFLLPSDYLDYAKSVLFSLGFASNFYFYFTGLEYGSVEGILKPFLHTWSLSVEEQFYIFFPLMILFVYRFFTKKFLNIFIVFFLLSLVTAHLTSISSTSVSFYFLHTRIWELLAGSILACIEIKFKKRISFDNKVINQILPSLGLILIFNAIVFYDDTTLHPSFYTLLPVIGTCLVIWFAKKDEIITKIFSTKLFVGIGLISYSLYLWHYPIFAFFRYSLASGSFSKKILVIIFVLVASIFTYLFIEKPFRNKKKISLKYLIIFMSSVTFILFTVNFFIIKKNGFDKRYIFDNINLDNWIYHDERANFTETIKDLNQLDKDKKTILIIGNSHGNDFFNLFYLNKDLFTEYNFTLVTSDIYCLENFFSNKTFCNKKVSNNDLFKLNKSDIIILSTKWSDKDLKQLDNIVSGFKTSNKQVILTTSAPEFKTYGRFTLIDRFILFNNRLPNKNEIDTLEKEYFDQQNSNEYNNNTNEFLNLIAVKHKIKILNKASYQCNYKLKKCQFFTDEQKKINYDKDHYTLDGAKYLGKFIYDNKWLNLN